MTASILIVEDDRMQATLLDTLVRKNGLESAIVGDGHAALAYLRSPQKVHVRVVIMDMMMEGLNGLETMKVMTQEFPGIPVIFLTAVHDLNLAVEVMRLGAFDYLTKPYNAERMMVTIRNAFRLGAAQNKIGQIKWTSAGTLRFGDLIGHDKGLAPVIAMGRRIARTDIPVLVMGETGVGKEVLARAIHGESTRHDKPFIAVNCGAIPEQLIESILFGHEKGAFTGATEKMPGKFREADGGTIFLDEIGEMPLSAQTRLLRVLQQKEIEPVGSPRPQPVNVRVISATNRDLATEVAAGRFREDLYFRLNVIPVTLPPLRQRQDDIIDLALHFIDRFVESDNFPRRKLTEDAIQALMHHDWPGNIREIENTIRRAMIMTDGKFLHAQDLALSAQPRKEKTTSTPAIAGAQKSQLFINMLDAEGQTRHLDDLEQDILNTTLKHYQGNMTAASRALGIAKSTYYRKINALGPADNDQDLGSKSRARKSSKIGKT